MMPQRALGGAAGADRSLYGDIAALGLAGNLKLCLDAGSADSFDGAGQMWNDLAGGGHDFFRGVDAASGTDDPAFIGLSGGASINEKMALQGDDFFYYDSAAEPWMDAMQQEGLVWSAIAWVYVTSVSGGCLLANGQDTGTGRRGFRWSINAAGNAISITDTSVVRLSKTADSVMSTGAVHMMGVTLDDDGGAGESFLYLDGGYDQVSAADTFNAAAAYQSTAAYDRFCIGVAGGRGEQFLPSISLIFGLAVWQGGKLSKADMDLIWNRRKKVYGL